MSHDDNMARANLRLAGALQEIHNSWVKRIDSYFSELERLISGEWLDSSDLAALVREAKSASREAMEGLSNDLTSELMHASSEAFQRHNADRNSLNEEILDLRSKITRLMSWDEGAVLLENETLREALFALPEFQLLSSIQTHSGCSYKELGAINGCKSSAVRKNVKSLVGRGYVRIDKNTKPHSLHFVSAPWSNELAAPMQIQNTMSNLHVFPSNRS